MVVVILLLLLTSAAVANDGTQLLCFGAEWCQPCREMQPTFDRLTREGYPIRKIDVDKYGALANRYQITAVPTQVLVDEKGQKIDQIVQATDYETLRRFFRHHQIAPTTTTIRGQSPPLESPVRPNGGVTKAVLSSGNETVGTRRKSLASTVRLRIEDENGHSFGTGTVVDLHGQEGLVLTCGHIFRASQGKGRILIERFDSQTAEPTTGTLISYDIDRDVALVSMKLTRPIEVAKLAPLQYQARKGDSIYSIGCNQGAPPTIMEGAVNQIDKYLGPPNITASGRPVVGRSGGGLFNSAGELIGVCSAADPEIDEGLYAALPRVYYELDRNGLSFVYQTPNQQPIANVASTASVSNLAEPPLPSMQQPRDFANNEVPTVAEVGETKSRELVCILKSEDGSEGKAYVIENPSDVLLDYLKREAAAVK